MEDDNDGFNFSEGFVFEDSDDEKQAPAQPAWAFPDSKREMERELKAAGVTSVDAKIQNCLLYTSPNPRDVEESRMPSSA